MNSKRKNAIILINALAVAILSSIPIFNIIDSHYDRYYCAMFSYSDTVTFTDYSFTNFLEDFVYEPYILLVILAIPITSFIFLKLDDTRRASVFLSVESLATLVISIVYFFRFGTGDWSGLFSGLVLFALALPMLVTIILSLMGNFSLKTNTISFCLFCVFASAVTFCIAIDSEFDESFSFIVILYALNFILSIMLYRQDNEYYSEQITYEKVNKRVIIYALAILLVIPFFVSAMSVSYCDRHQYRQHYHPPQLNDNPDYMVRYNGLVGHYYPAQYGNGERSIDIEDFDFSTRDIVLVDKIGNDMVCYDDEFFVKLAENRDKFDTITSETSRYVIENDCIYNASKSCIYLYFGDDESFRLDDCYGLMPYSLAFTNIKSFEVDNTKVHKIGDYALAECPIESFTIASNTEYGACVLGSGKSLREINAYNVQSITRLSWMDPEIIKENSENNTTLTINTDSSNIFFIPLNTNRVVLNLSCRKEDFVRDNPAILEMDGFDTNLNHIELVDEHSDMPIYLTINFS